MTLFSCRFCTNKVRRSRGICFACLLEGRSDEPGLPMQEEEVTTLHLSNGEAELSARQIYHGATIRDDI